MIFATNNEGKLRELRSIFKQEEIKSLKEFGISVEICEDQDSFYGNALKKAKEIFKLTGLPVIADDSGLCITALNGFPGVLTHRFSGDNKTDEQINESIIEHCKGLKDRSAKVVCYLVYYDGENEIVAKGEIFGTITLKPRGINGFGFDPIFELNNGKTLAELDPEIKNSCSARYLATKQLYDKLNNIYQNSRRK